MDVKVRSHVTFVFVSPLTHSLCCVAIDACLPPANEVWGKVIFLHLSVILCTGVCLVLGAAGPGGVWSQGVPGPRGGLVPGGGGAWWRPSGRLLLRAVRILLECILVNYKIDVDTSANVKCEQGLRFVYYVNLACTEVIASKSSNLYFREH